MSFDDRGQILVPLNERRDSYEDVLRLPEISYQVIADGIPGYGFKSLRPWEVDGKDSQYEPTLAVYGLQYEEHDRFFIPEGWTTEDVSRTSGHTYNSFTRFSSLDINSGRPHTVTREVFYANRLVMNQVRRDLHSNVFDLPIQANRYAEEFGEIRFYEDISTPRHDIARVVLGIKRGQSQWALWNGHGTIKLILDTFKKASGLQRGREFADATQNKIQRKSYRLYL